MPMRTAASAAMIFAAAALAPAPAAADRLYETALAQCRAAAAESEDPTGYACDWKAIATGPEDELSGRYTFEEEGLSGEMTILESPGGGAPALVGILTVSSDPNAHTCSAAIEAGREGDALVAKPADSDGCELSIAGGSKPGVAAVTANEACRTYYCGMRAAFDGTWKRQAK